MSKPWRVSKATDTGNYIVMEPIGGQVICEVEPGPEAKKNAYRIAAVGELLEALKAIAEGCAFPEDDIQRAVVYRARAATDKAEAGE